MQTSPSTEVTQLLKAWSQGDKAALDKLTPLVYQELHKLARCYLQRERPDHTLQPTALIHEAYIRLVDQSLPQWQTRTHFFRVAARLMRQILVDHARAHLAAKRGGGAKVPLDEGAVASKDCAAILLVLDDALKALADFDQRKSRIIELRYFGGLTAEEISEEVGVSVATVGREVRVAEAWLNREISQKNR